MENVLAITFGIAVVACGLILFGVYALYGGRKADLANAKVGQIFNFEYLQPLNGDPERFLAKVIEPVYTLDNRRIDMLNRRSSYRRGDSNFKRTNHLVTCQTVDGNIRQFYAERVVNCRRPLFAGFIM